MRTSFSGSQTIANYLLNGYWDDTDRGSHHWNLDASRTLTVDISYLSAEGSRLARAAFESWEAVANIHFEELSGGADIRFTNNGDTSSSRVMYRGNEIASATVNVGEGLIDLCGPGPGTWAFRSFIHEIGHALGLGHPAVYAEDEVASRIFRNDSDIESVMSYIGAEEDRTSRTAEASAGHCLTPMLADILAVQALYGAPEGGVSAGSTVYGQGTNLETYLGEVLETAIIPNDTRPGGFHSVYHGSRPIVYDESGTDTIDFSNDDWGQNVDLLGGSLSNVYGQTLNFGIAHGTVIENYVAGEGDDVVSGNKANNRLFGNAGNDQLFGQERDDLLDGGSGADTLKGGNGCDTLKGEQDSDRLLGQKGRDLLDGGDGDDRLFGHQGKDALSGGSGNDYLLGGDDADALVGGDGNDTMSGGVGADQIDGGWGGDNLNGGADDDCDVFIYNDRLDSIADQTGRDTIWGFQSGVDRIDFSGLATDSFSYSGEQAADYSVWSEIHTGGLLVRADLDGDAVPDLEFYLDGVSSLTGSDFIF